MKLKHSAIAIIVLLAASPAVAGLPAESELPSAEPCTLTQADATALDTAWVKLAQRFFLASIEAVENPGRFQQVSLEVREGLTDLRSRFGHQCVSPIRLIRRLAIR